MVEVRVTRKYSRMVERRRVRGWSMRSEEVGLVVVHSEGAMVALLFFVVGWLAFSFSFIKTAKNKTNLVRG